MKTLGLHPKKLIIALCVLAVGILGLGLFVLTFVQPIQGMKVYVEAPTNAPAWVIAEASTNESMKELATNSWTTQIPFADATNKFVSETDIFQIKQAIPWSKTILHFYVPEAVVVESPTSAYAEFWRQHLFLYVHLKKEGGSWNVSSISSGTADLIGPPNWKQRVAASLPH